MRPQFGKLPPAIVLPIAGMQISFITKSIQFPAGGGAG
jgi:hypothetical protein